jgi:hypothetical protein
MMARGKHFNHKERGHEPTIPIHGQEVPAKQTKNIGYDIESVASESNPPVTFKEDE